jgi:predicted ATPase/DNA-binding SARP family transcriptional activator
MNDQLHIRLLGPFEVVAGEIPANITGGKRHGLLAVLALRRGRVVAVDALIEALWGEDLPAAPRNALQHHVARLRATLGQHAIGAAPDGYVLREASVDAVQFEELLAHARAGLRAGDARAAADAAAAAVALWRGPALQGLTDTAWSANEARRLEALRVDALEERFEAALALGEHREIASELRTTLEDNPFRERMWGQLMVALYRSGRQADALDAFRDARRVLAEHLGLEPGPELRKLQDAIFAHDPAIAPVTAPPARRGHLPAPSTSFVARERELAQVVALLREHRLVTLTGPPGVGKSRLALEAGRALADEVADGVYHVDLAQAGRGADAAALVGRALGVRGGESLERVVAHLRDSAALVLLDGCGRVVDAAAEIAAAILAECPAMRVLATSREVLHVVGEARVVVAPLGLPESEDDAASPAVQLFAERARAARPSFELTPENAQRVADICHWVDGLPLAIELAAARMNALGLAELSGIVERRLTLLHGAHPTDVARGALNTLVEWSYDLLHGDEKTLLHHVAVHRGGASLPALVEIAQSFGLDETTVTYLLGALVDKSIVSVSFPQDDVRYDLLDTVRDYALEQLHESGALQEACLTHARYYATLAGVARAGLHGPDWRAWSRRLQLENDNLWAALEYARDAADAEIASRLGTALWWYFAVAERVSEGRRFLELARAIAADDAPAHVRLELAGSLCFLAREELDFDTALEQGEQALALAPAATTPTEAVVARAPLALTLAETGDGERAAALAAEASAAAVGDGWSEAAASLVRAQVAAHADDAAAVAALTAETRRRAEQLGYDAFVVPAILLEAWVAERTHQRDAAEAAYRAAAEVAARVEFRDHVAFALTRVAAAAFARGDLREAQELVMRAAAAAGPDPDSWAAADARVQLAALRAAAGDADGAAALYRGVLDWDLRPRAHLQRESLFVVLGGDPAGSARAGLAALAAPAEPVA